MKTSTLLALAAAGAGWYFFGDRFGLRKVDTTEVGRVVNLAPGKRYSVTVQSDRPLAGGTMVELNGGLRVVATPGPAGTSQVVLTFVAPPAPPTFQLMVGQRFPGSIDDAKVVRIQEH